MAVESREDAEAEGPVVRYVFGNRCDAPVVVDLAAIKATVRYRDGHETQMRVFDPQGVIKPGVLEAHARGWEVLEYQPADAADLAAVIEVLCLDLSRVDRDQPRPQPASTCVEIGSLYRIAEARR
jgi:hypothetical protein